MSEEKTFSWFPTMTRMVERVGENMPDKVGEFVMGLVNYGAKGIEPEFTDMALIFAFEGLRDDIDHSIKARYNNKGGRPPKNKTSVSDQETPVTKNEKGYTEVSETKTGDTGDKTPFTVLQNKTEQNNTEQNRTKGVLAGGAVADKTAPPPTPKGKQPYCPRCKDAKPMWKDSMGKYHCDSCFDAYKREEVVWR